MERLLYLDTLSSGRVGRLSGPSGLLGSCSCPRLMEVENVLWEESSPPRRGFIAYSSDWPQTLGPPASLSRGRVSSLCCDTSSQALKPFGLRLTLALLTTVCPGRVERKDRDSILQEDQGHKGLPRNWAAGWPTGSLCSVDCLGPEQVSGREPEACPEP